MFYFLMIVFSVFVYVPNSYAATYYVAKTGSNSRFYSVLLCGFVENV